MQIVLFPRKALIYILNRPHLTVAKLSEKHRLAGNDLSDNKKITSHLTEGKNFFSPLKL
jgi:hypothetical protein